MRTQPYSAPALDFEWQTGLTGLHTPWIMPEGQTHELAEDLANAFLDIVLNDLGYRNARGWDGEKIRQAFATTHQREGAQIIAQFDALAVLNPALGALSFARDNPLDLIGVVTGAASQFNIDDLEFSVRASRETHLALKLQRERIEGRTGVHMSWVVSPKTMDKIEAQLDMRIHSAQTKSPARRPGF